MTARCIRITVITVLGLACAVPAEANQLCDYWNCIVRDTKRRQCWPRPFVCPDRRDARVPLTLMIHNGWRSQNTLADHHFVAGTGKLTEAGQWKVRWVLSEAPVQHRTIYVHRTDDGELTAARMEETQKLAIQLTRDGRITTVLETSVPPRGWSAAEVDRIGRKFESSMPDPRLPKAEGESSD